MSEVTKESIIEQKKRFNKYEQDSPYYEDYYIKKEQIIPEEEAEEFKKTIRTPLPTSFRLTKISDAYPQVVNVIKEIVNEIPEELKPKSFEWTPDTYQLEIDRKQVRKCESYNKLHRFMVLMNESGEISRQEVVSMLPAILLDVQPGNSVLDVCAAPGSKTFQMVEMIGKDGCVVANDVDKQRAYLLTHQTKRLSTPNILITNYPAQELNFGGFQFDRMLCDVPCSGDGTVRKNVDARTRWHVMNAHTLHREQLDIMKNVIKHVKVGGKFVYSTCSMNPIEDEAVVAELLRLYKGTIQLVDVRNTLPSLIYSEGMSKWAVLNKHFKEITEKNDNISQSAFPPTEEEAKEFHLDYTLRILPHKQNTGGFYVAVFMKTAETPVLEEKLSKKQQKKLLASEKQQEETKEQQEAAKEPTEHFPKKRRRGMAPIDDQEFSQLLKHPNGENVYNEIKQSYGLSDAFPKEQLYIIGDECSNIHFLGKHVAEISQALKIVNGGIRIFKKQKNETGNSYRIVSEGIPILADYIGEERTIQLSHDVFLKLLTQDVPLSEFGREFKGMGCYIARITDGILKGNTYPTWVGKVNLSILTPKQDLESLRFLFNIVPLNKKKQTTDVQEIVEKVEKN